jgi:hypothetical protein
MTGHLVALTVSLVKVGYLGEVEVQRVRRVVVFVLPKKGQELENRDKVESLSIEKRHKRQGRRRGTKEKNTGVVQFQVISKSITGPVRNPSAAIGS